MSGEEVIVLPICYVAFIVGASINIHEGGADTLRVLLLVAAIIWPIPLIGMCMCCDEKEDQAVERRTAAREPEEAEEPATEATTEMTETGDASGGDPSEEGEGPSAEFIVVTCFVGYTACVITISNGWKFMNEKDFNATGVIAFIAALLWPVPAIGCLYAIWKYVVEEEKAAKERLEAAREAREAAAVEMIETGDVSGGDPSEADEEDLSDTANASRKEEGVLSDTSNASGEDEGASSNTRNVSGKGEAPTMVESSWKYE